MSDKLQKESFYSSSKEINDIDLGKIFRFLLMQSKFIILVSLATFLIAYINYHFSTKQYLIQSLLQYEPFNQNIFDPSKTLQMASSRPSADVKNLTKLYESRTNYLKVISDLKLNINIEGLESNEDIDINISSENKDNSEVYKLKMTFSDTNFTILGENSETIQTKKYGQEIIYNDLKIYVNSAQLNKYRPIEIQFQQPEKMYNLLKNQIDVDDNSPTNSFFSNESLITVSLIDDNVERGKEIINYANNIFLNQRVFVETEKSRKAIDFIDQNIQSIESSVKTKKNKLKEFREKNKSIDVSLEIQAIISKIESLDESLNSIDIELAKAKEIYTLNNPVYLNLLNKKKLIQKQKEEVIAVVEMMPKEQQEYIDLYNDVEISQALFEELESRRLGFSILEASTIADIRVVDDAFVVSLVNPKPINILIYSFIAFVVACFFAIFRGFYFLPVSNPAEIFDNNIYTPIIGVVPNIEDFEDPKNDIKLTSSIESLIVNINAIQNNKPLNNLITITSPSPGNGKSTISINLAEGFANIGKKVLIVDNDLKRGVINKNYNVKSISENIFYSINKSTINDYKIRDNLYVIPRVKGLNNTFQFLYSYRYKEKIKFFKDTFDYIIFDTGPVLSVADSSILIEQSDLNILVVRHSLNKINEIKQSLDNFKQINKDVDGIIYNAYAKPKSYYGYYGIYGNYSYQYYANKYLDDSYEYEKKD